MKRKARKTKIKKERKETKKEKTTGKIFRKRKE